MYVRWGKSIQDETEGVRVEFVYNDQFMDEFQFYDPADIACVMKILSCPTVVPEFLLMVVRNRMNLTVH